MKKIFYVTAFGLLLVSCGGQSDTTTPVHDSIPADSGVVAVPNIAIDINALLAKYTIRSKTPFIQDSTYFEKQGMIESSALSGDEVKYLSYNFIENDMAYSGKSTIEDVLFFDSLKTNDAYEQYVEVLDIGMMRDANAYAAEKITLDDSTDLLLWYVDFGTYEACPYFAGQNLYASVFRNNEVRSCTLIGEMSGGGDAPYWSETMTLFSVSNGEMLAVKTDRNGGDEDEAGNEIMTESEAIYFLEIINGNWVVTAKNETGI